MHIAASLSTVFADRAMQFVSLEMNQIAFGRCAVKKKQAPAVQSVSVM
jgi:hypothetical protein